MNHVYLILLYQLIPSDVVTKNPSPPPDSIKFGATFENKVVLSVNLKMTKRVLANENLPIWTAINEIPEGNSPDDTKDDKLMKQHGVMERLGEFTTYQDAQTSSAAIYFHNRRELDGVIDYRWFIQGLSINKVDPMGETMLTLNRDGVYARQYLQYHYFNPPEDAPRAGVNYHGHRKTYNRHLYDGYPEILVLVAWNMIDWSNAVEPANLYTAIVSDVLTLMNAVDMLYTKLEFTNIQFNIAGIVIEAEPNAFYFLPACEFPYTAKDGNVISALNISCVQRALQQYVVDHNKIIRPDSYDVAILLTRKRLFLIPSDTEIPAETEGLATSRKSLYISRMSHIPFALTAAIHVGDYLENYVTIAHELAHSMNVEHDWRPFFTWDKKCCGNIMKTFSGFCENCLTWSKTTERSLNLFFSSPDCCQFINKPQSLEKPGRREILTAEEQCRCYGYRTAEKYNSARNSRREICKEKLICHGHADGQSYQVINPMDGTICNENKVCWQKECQEIDWPKPHEKNAGWFWGLL